MQRARQSELRHPDLKLRGMLSSVAVVWLLLAAVSPLAATPPPASESDLRVYAHTLRHRSTQEALVRIRPLLSPGGTVEEQPRDNTLVIRDSQTAIDQIASVLESFDLPPEELRVDIQVVRAGPKRSGISPPSPEPVGEELAPELVAKLRDLLRYDDYRVMAKAGMTSKEGEEVTYSLGQGYKVSFRLGTVISDKRLKLQGFRVFKQHDNPANKGRRLEPEQLFHATLNVWLDRPFNLVLAQDDSSKEALMVTISCRREGETRP